MGAEAEAEVEEEEAKEEDDDNNQKPDVRYEADVIQDQRILDDDDSDDDVDEHSSKPGGKKEELEALELSAVNKETEDRWKIQNARRLRRKLQRIKIREVSKKDVMPDERANMVSNWKQSYDYEKKKK